MATTDTTVNNLIINKLTKAQYQGISNPSETELYLVPDEMDSAPVEGSTNPVASGGIYTALAGKQDTMSNATVLSGITSTKVSSWDAKQDALVSGTNIKTINNESLLGEGNITIEGASGGEANVIETVKVNGTALTPDSSKAVNITSVPAGIVTQDATHRFASDTEKTTWNEKQDALSYGELKGSLYRSNVSGGGAISISGTTGEFPTVTEEGTYIVVTEMSSSTQSYGLNVTFGGNTYSLSATDGKISDSREIVISSNKTWSASVTGSVASGTILSVKLYLVSGSVSVLGLTAVTNDYNDLSNKPTIPSAVTESTVTGWGFTKNTGTITGIKMNGASKGTSGVVDLGTVITSHQDISGKADKSAAIGSLSLSLDSTNYKITLSGTKVDGTAFTVQNVIDLPLESVVVNGSYNNSTKKVVLTLQNGSTVDFSVADLVSGLQSEITSTNKLSADLIADGTTNKTVTATEKSAWNGKQDVLVSGTNIKTANGESVLGNGNITSYVIVPIDATGLSSSGTKTISSSNPYNTINTAFTNGKDVYVKLNFDSSMNVPDLILPLVSQNYSSAPYTFMLNSLITGSRFYIIASVYINRVDIKFETVGTGTLDTTATGAQSTNASESLNGNVTLHKVSKTGSYNDLNNKPTIPTVNDNTITLTFNGTTVGTFTLNQNSNKTIDIGTIIGLPSFSASDNGKILGVVNGALAWITPTTIYTGTSTPSNSQGIDGDIYLQTN